MKQKCEIRFGLYRVNQSEYVILFYFDTPYPPSGRTAWLHSHLTKKIFSFFYTTCQVYLLFFRIAYLFKEPALCFVKILYYLVLDPILKP